MLSRAAENGVCEAVANAEAGYATTVSYTHLDVYKRQPSA